ncbi:hypothetical protein N181_08425 [Sinorhizobium fredii USDA 205]|uniref:PepSY domain-containing protein n=2 Tax=Rhizobium fredii TaxID=380 RepID=A0A844AIB6_RHIFR|nr:hypothetical protein [Sinorhizobium fredii]ASY72270.1 hypothetical protein SF83666_b56210 [Sinorhizobium fredii CCBAU 83666]KSV92047.1 hypothetical protein N181_08425 [Sinorhizobium fredii USDA 205]MQX12924.1 hypothetical protein [Sinorhizobium fredii]GEC33517.1 hypothetical protein EFR01_36880 [Sinorhizobium fredii]GLS11153.1 hypothetical protein GCM10007864_47840 [Sinorhizobium fredii]
MKVRLMTTVILAVLLGAPLALYAEEISADKQKAIADMLATMKCEVDPANIEAGGEGYELDDVFCSDGQYDMNLNADLTVADKRKE